MVTPPWDVGARTGPLGELNAPRVESCDPGWRSTKVRVGAKLLPSGHVESPPDTEFCQPQNLLGHPPSFGCPWETSRAIARFSPEPSGPMITVWNRARSRSVGTS